MNFPFFFVSLQSNSGKYEYMGKILRDMTAEEQTLYDKESKTFPWLKTIKMSDDEFFECLERDMGKTLESS